MGEDDRDPAAVSAGFAERMADLGPVTISAGDWTTSPEAIAVLREHGVDAWRTWCSEHKPEA